MRLTLFTSDRITAEVRETIERIVRLGLTRFATQVRQVHVSVRDQNGPKGGDDQRCVLKIVLNGLPEVIIQEICPSVEQAVGLAVDRAARNIGRALDRRLRNREYLSRRHLTGTGDQFQEWSP